MIPRNAAPTAVEQPWALDATAVMDALGTDDEVGLRAAEAAARLDRSGPNEFVSRQHRPPWRRALEPLTTMPTAALMVAGAGAALLGDHLAAGVLMIVVGIHWITGIVHADRSGPAWAAIARMASPSARVVRDGAAQVVPASSVVPGDIVRLEAGDVVPADLRLLDATALYIDERALTGASEPSLKTSGVLPGRAATPLADQRDMALQGTVVSAGHGTGVVTATGVSTALARTAELFVGARSEPAPLGLRPADLGRALAATTVGLILFVTLVGLAHGAPVDRLLQTVVGFAIALAPAALPTVVFVSLAVGARRLSRRGARVRDPSVMETIGSVSVICTDATGTLTSGRVLAERVWTPFGEYHLGGTTYEPAGALVGDADPSDDPFLPRLGRVAAACATAVLAAPQRHTDPWNVTGDPTDAALVTLAARLGSWARDLREDHPLLARFTLDPMRRWTSTLRRDHGRIWVTVRGAPGALVPYGDPDQQAAWTRAAETAERWAADGHQVVALAERSLDAFPVSVDAAVTNLSLVGLVGMADPPRRGSAAAIAGARRAGIRTVVIRDHDPRAAQGISRRLSIVDDDLRMLTGAELDALGDEDLDRIVEDVAVYAPAGEEQKQRIIESWKRGGAVVAVAGDGADDAASFGRADVGIAKGVRGTSISKLMADMVLEGDDHVAIISAVEEGRRSQRDIRRFVRFTLTSSVAASVVLLLAPLAGLSMPLSMVQVLWIKLVVDGLVGLALIAEPTEPDMMRRGPRSSREPITADGSGQHILWIGLLMGVVTLSVGVLASDRGWPWQTMVFCLLALLQLGHALAVRSERRSCRQLGWRTSVVLAAAIGLVAALQLATMYVPHLRPLFATEALTWVQLAVVLAASMLAFGAVEGAKWLRQQRSGRPIPQERAAA